MNNSLIKNYLSSISKIENFSGVVNFNLVQGVDIKAIIVPETDDCSIKFEFNDNQYALLNDEGLSHLNDLSPYWSFTLPAFLAHKTREVQKQLS